MYSVLSYLMYIEAAVLYTILPYVEAAILCTSERDKVLDRCTADNVVSVA